MKKRKLKEKLKRQQSDRSDYMSATPENINWVTRVDPDAPPPEPETEVES